MQIPFGSLIWYELQNVSLTFVSYSEGTVTVPSQVYSDRMLFTWQHPSDPVEAGDLAHLGIVPRLSGLDIYWIGACAAHRILSVSLQTIALTSSATKNSRTECTVSPRLTFLGCWSLHLQFIFALLECTNPLCVLCYPDIRAHVLCSHDAQVPSEPPLCSSVLPFHNCSSDTIKLPPRNSNYFFIEK